VLGIIGGLSMLNYDEKIIELHRFFIGVIFICLSYSLGRPSAIKQLSKCVGASHIDEFNLYIESVECLAFIVGSVWGIFSLLKYKSVMLTLLFLIVL
jgi:hypothetical protein